MENTDHMFARAMRMLALATFLIGTIIFLFCYYLSGKFLMLGLGYIVVAGIINLSLFSITLSMGLKQRCRKLIISALVLILNVPVAAVYVCLVV